MRKSRTLQKQIKDSVCVVLSYFTVRSLRWHLCFYMLHRYSVVNFQLSCMLFKCCALHLKCVVVGWCLS